MKKKEKINRLSSAIIHVSDWHYLHYYYLNRDIIDAIKQFAKGNVIDIGCGNKPYELIFKKYVANYTGCDIEQSNLEMVDIICDATAIPLPDSSFDTVFSSQTIEHLQEYQLFIKESFRLLKPGGYFIIAGPMYWPLHEAPNDYYRFTKHGFEYILKKSGFQIEKIYENGGMWATGGQSILHAITKSRSKHLFPRIIRFLFVKLRFKRLHNFIFRWIDNVDYNPVNTMNYVVVASKK